MMPKVSGIIDLYIEKANHLTTLYFYYFID